MEKSNLLLLGILAGVVLILISYLGYSTFNIGISECGSGQKWPTFFPSSLAVCISTIIPHPITKPFLYGGIIITILSFIGFVALKFKLIKL